MIESLRAMPKEYWYSLGLIIIGAWRLYGLPKNEKEMDWSAVFFVCLGISGGIFTGVGLI